MKLIGELIVRSFILLVTSYLVPGFRIDSYKTALAVAVVLGLLNTLVKPILILFTLPATILTLGLFIFVINAFLLLIASSFIRGFHIDSFFTAVAAAVLISLISALLTSMLK